MDEAQQLYDGMYDLTNTHDTLLIVYAPWCKYCKNIEAEVSTHSETFATWGAMAPGPGRD